MLSFIQEGILGGLVKFPFKAFQDFKSLPTDLKRIRNAYTQFNNASGLNDKSLWGKEMASGAKDVGSHLWRPSLFGYGTYKLGSGVSNLGGKFVEWDDNDDITAELRKVQKLEKEKLDVLKKQLEHQFKVQSSNGKDVEKMIRRAVEEERVKGQNTLENFKNDTLQKTNDLIQKVREEELNKFNQQREVEKAAAEEAYKNRPWYDKSISDLGNNASESIKSGLNTTKNEISSVVNSARDSINSGYDQTSNLISDHPYLSAGAALGGVGALTGAALLARKLRKK